MKKKKPTTSFRLKSALMCVTDICTKLNITNVLCLTLLRYSIKQCITVICYFCNVLFPTLPVPDGNYRCGSCAQCSYTHKFKTFNHPHTGKAIRISGVITCSTKRYIQDLVSMRPCIWRQNNTVKTMNEHHSPIRTGDEHSPIAAHFKLAGHNVSTLRYVGVEHVKNSPPRGLSLFREKRFGFVFLTQCLQTV